MEAVDRKILKQKLKNKIKESRCTTENNNNMKKKMKTDPQTAMLNMGIDNIEVLKMASSLVKNPEATLKNIYNMKK